MDAMVFPRRQISSFDWHGFLGEEPWLPPGSYAIDPAKPHRKASNSCALFEKGIPMRYTIYIHIICLHNFTHIKYINNLIFNIIIFQSYIYCLFFNDLYI
jgi:hypothetical protein